MTIPQMIDEIEATERQDFIETLDGELIDKKNFIEKLKFFSEWAKRQGFPTDTPAEQILAYFLTSKLETPTPDEE